MRFLKNAVQFLPLDSKAGEILNTLTAGLDVDDSRTINRGGEFLPVEVSRLTKSLYSVAHYVDLGGDLAADPAMEFLKSKAGLWYPISYRLDTMGVYQVGAEYDWQGKVSNVNERNQAEQVEFANGWMRAIAYQQNLPGREHFEKNPACGCGAKLMGNPCGCGYMNNPAVNFVTPPQNQGQIVTCSYAVTEHFVVQRCFDASDRTATYYAARYTPELEKWAENDGGVNRLPPAVKWSRVNLAEAARRGWHTQYQSNPPYDIFTQRERFRRGGYRSVSAAVRSAKNTSSRTGLKTLVYDRGLPGGRHGRFVAMFDPAKRRAFR